MKKKRLALTLVLLLTLTLAACGGGGDGGGGGDDAPSAGSGDAPLTRDDGSASTNADGSASGDGTDVDMGAVLAGDGPDTLLSSYDAATRQQMIADAKEDGADLTFGADGSATLEYEDGSVLTQNPDGTWNHLDLDGSVSNYGSDWPDNEYTRHVPKPEFGVTATLIENDVFSVAFVDATTDQIKAYAEQIKAKGFTIDARIEDQEVMDMVIYTYTAKNADGWEVEVTSAVGMAGMSIRKP